MHLKVHESYRKVVAICDEELLGKKFEEGKKQLDVRENFYKDKTIDDKTLVSMMIRLRKEDATFNIVGEKSIQLAIECGIVGEGNIGRVAGVPFALVLL